MTDAPLEWIVLYSDGSTQSNLDGAPSEIRRNGVMQVFYASEATGVSVESSLAGFWLWKDGMWFGCDDAMGFWDHLFHYPNPGPILFGRTVKDEQWEGEVSRKTKELMGLDKSAWRKRERRY